jgi:hypothetical protein
VDGADWGHFEWAKKTTDPKEHNFFLIILAIDHSHSKCIISSLLRLLLPGSLIGVSVTDCDPKGWRESNGPNQHPRWVLGLDQIARVELFD